jgi:hypothetical protein
MCAATVHSGTYNDFVPWAKNSHVVIEPCGSLQNTTTVSCFEPPQPASCQYFTPVHHSGNCIYHPILTFNNSEFYPQNVLTCFVLFLE